MADTKVQSPETTAVEDNHQRITSSSPTPPPPPSHWMGMRYPSPMMMPHHMMYPPPPYSPYHHHNHMYQHQHHQSRGNKHQNASNAENKTIWIGDLLHWMDENYLNSCFAPAGEVSASLSLSLFIYFNCLFLCFVINDLLLICFDFCDIEAGNKYL